MFELGTDLALEGGNHFDDWCGLSKILAVCLIAADNGAQIPTIAHPPKTEKALRVLRRQNEVKTITKWHNERDRGVYIATTSTSSVGLVRVKQCSKSTEFDDTPVADEGSLHRG